MNTKRIEKTLIALKPNKKVYFSSKAIVIALKTGRLDIAKGRLDEYFNHYVKTAFIHNLYMDVYEEINEFYNASITALIEAK